MRRLTGVIRWIVLSAVFLSGTTHAATIVVDGSGGGDVATLGEAVATAFANGEADEIVVKAGTYTNTDGAGNVMAFIGEDEIAIRGEDPSDRPVIVVEPNFDETVPGEGDGIKIRMGGSLAFENLVFLPSENFTFLDEVDDMFAIVNAGTEGNPVSLDLTFRNVLITHGWVDNTPATVDGFDDPRWSDNTFRDDAINIDLNGPPDDELNLLLDNVIVSGYGTEADADALVIDGPQIEATITGGTRFTYIRRRALYNYNAESVTVEGTDDNPVVVYAAGETMARASAGVNRWNHLWCVGIDEGEGGMITGFAARIDPNGGASLTATNCIFSTAFYDGIFMNFDAPEPISYEISNCTFYNVPELVRFGFVGEPGPSENVSVTTTDCIIDNADWVAPNDGTYFSPEPTVVHYGDAENTLAQLTLNNLAYRTQTFVSSMSGSREPTTNGNIIENADFQFKATELTRDNFDDFLVIDNCSLLEGKATNGAPLDGARPSACATDIEDWQLH